ncbi:MAG: 50S ribosomal protein L20 [Bacilli bacterium]|nr:50S ribosomal protein L20 [Bacilli bacterium]
MARVKNGAVTKARHKKVLKAAKGYFGSKHRLYKSAKEQLMHSGQYAFRDRKQKKRDFRKLWITRINAACRLNEISYSRFIEGLNKAGVEVNRKMLSEIAINDPKTFSELVKVAKDGKNGKIKKSEEVKIEEVTIGAKAAKKEVKATEKKETTKKETAKKEVAKKEVAKKEVAKKEVKKETKKADVDYSKMTVAELKEVAAKKKINVTGMKKAEIVEALSK